VRARVLSRSRACARLGISLDRCLTFTAPRLPACQPACLPAGGAPRAHCHPAARRRSADTGGGGGGEGEGRWRQRRREKEEARRENRGSGEKRETRARRTTANEVTLAGQRNDSTYVRIVRSGHRPDKYPGIVDAEAFTRNYGKLPRAPRPS